MDNHIPPFPNAQASVVDTSTRQPRLRTFYAVVLYDFTAERPDELDVHAGEPLMVVAQINREWLVAKPIGRPSGAGLIPAVFIEVQDPTTGKPIEDVDGLIMRGDLPDVAEWKRRTLTSHYKTSGIPLGVANDPVPPLPANGRGGDFCQSRAITLLPPGWVVSASVSSFHFEGGQYWFQIQAHYAPYPPEDHASAPAERDLVLYRVYGDFYDLQIALLDVFPVETGRQTPNGIPTPPRESNQPLPDRLLPFVPGPLSYVDEWIATIQCKELDEYVASLCGLALRGGVHVLSHPIVRGFFSPRPGDTMMETTVKPSQKQIKVYHPESAREGSGPELVLPVSGASDPTSQRSGTPSPPTEGSSSSMPLDSKHHRRLGCIVTPSILPYRNVP
ncbi:hypothetical protein OPQ81_002940 [Rhizoctonia solani]|nr:hypothetical protein OPQ81_002940 [Rhizoctonia solani]